MNPLEATSYFEKKLLSEEEFIREMRAFLKEREKQLEKIHARVEAWQKFLKVNDHE